MKISETTLGAVGDALIKGARDVKGAVAARDTSGPGGRTLGAILSPDRIASGVSLQDKMAENNFVKDFTSKAIQAINGAIQSGYVDPNKVPENISLQPAPTAPATNKQDQQPSPAATPAADTGSTTTEPLTFGGEKYTKGPNGWVTSKGKAADTNTAKILDQAAQQAGQQPPAQQGQPQQPPAQSSSTQSATTQQGQTQPSAAKPRVRIDPKTGQYAPADSVKKSSVPQGGGRIKGAGLSQTPNAVKKRQQRAATKTVAPATPAAPRQTVAQKAQGYLQQQALKKKAAPGVIKESLLSENEYKTMNYVFESIMNQMFEADAQPTDSNTEENPAAVSIPEFLVQQVMPDYFENIPIQKAEPQFKALLQKIPSTWNKGNSKAELQSIAKLAYSLAKKTKKSDIEQQAGQGAQITPAQSGQKTAKGPEIKGTDWGALGKNL